MNIQRDEIFLPNRDITVSSRIYRPQQGSTEKNRLVLVRIILRNWGQARTRTEWNFKTLERSWIEKILKVSDRFEPVGPWILGLQWKILRACHFEEDVFQGETFDLVNQENVRRLKAESKFIQHLTPSWEHGISIAFDLKLGMEIHFYNYNQVLMGREQSVKKQTPGNKIWIIWAIWRYLWDLWQSWSGFAMVTDLKCWWQNS